MYLIILIKKELFAENKTMCLTSQFFESTAVSDGMMHEEALVMHRKVLVKRLVDRSHYVRSFEGMD